MRRGSGPGPSLRRGREMAYVVHIVGWMDSKDGGGDRKIAIWAEELGRGFFFRIPRRHAFSAGVLEIAVAEFMRETAKVLHSV